ncbi:hypothetical protein AMJ83_04800 [candidate division WOR_3 bacterium SM23_42]|uniref:phosphoribosylglycinamide formyltransferase 1 n=1 Tax=candidate division WOR_3 bacterium SM23_42 TaxID=1703779 RepID=A0A0S8FSU9_UNCW3|nr:MAG: hypothetical protein AMJ83_04800 [candidate division WOR_3 bacterium SM23_42]
MKNIAVLASGRGSNLEAIIKNIENGTCHANLACVISDNKDARALQIARDHGVKAIWLDPGPKKTWLAFKGRILNIHPALLPSFPGLDVQRKAIEYGVKFSGCTVHFVTEDVDAGAIITQAAVPVLDDDTPDTLAARILKEEHRIYTEAINIILSGKYRIEGRRVIKTG